MTASKTAKTAAHVWGGVRDVLALGKGGEAKWGHAHCSVFNYFIEFQRSVCVTMLVRAAWFPCVRVYYIDI